MTKKTPKVRRRAAAAPALVNPLPVFRARAATRAELSRCVALVPPDELGQPPARVAELWRRWQREHTLNVGVIEVTDRGTPRVVGLGVTAWLSPAGVEEALRPSDEVFAARLYARPDGAPSPLLTYDALCEGHREQTLTLAMLHFWSALHRGDPGFIELLMHAQLGFRELHEGYGLEALYDEAYDDWVVVLAQAGLWPVLPRRNGRTMMGLNRDEALHAPGSTTSFLFLAPAARLCLTGACQRMVTLALRQLTDEGIAGQLGCSRDYVRTLWMRVYEALEGAGVLPSGEASNLSRGPERRRLALEFFRTHPQELRPGLPTR